MRSWGSNAVIGVDLDYEVIGDRGINADGQRERDCRNGSNAPILIGCVYRNLLQNINRLSPATERDSAVSAIAVGRMCDRMQGLLKCVNQQLALVLGERRTSPRSAPSTRC